ncbi:nuclear transport factor 2 family protein [Oceanithermus sp.]
MENREREVWETLHRHLAAIYAGDWETYLETTAEDVSVYEWFVTPHRIDGLSFHEFMMEHDWAGAGSDWRYDLLDPRLQLFGETAVVSYTLLLTISAEAGLRHRTVNESRVLVRSGDGWKVVHVHKSPGERSA